MVFANIPAHLYKTCELSQRHVHGEHFSMPLCLYLGWNVPRIHMPLHDHIVCLELRDGLLAMGCEVMPDGATALGRVLRTVDLRVNISLDENGFVRARNCLLLYIRL